MAQSNLPPLVISRISNRIMNHVTREYTSNQLHEIHANDNTKQNTKEALGSIRISGRIQFYYDKPRILLEY